jgi:hypothetical protein
MNCTTIQQILLIAHVRYESPDLDQTVERYLNSGDCRYST